MGVSPRDEMWMRQALELAEQAKSEGEVPIGAILVHRDQVVGAGYNRPISSCDPTSHAELEALRAAGQTLRNYRLPETVLYVTLEPCVMCMGAIVHARVRRLVYGASDPKRGAAGSVEALHRADFLNHRVEVVGGVLADESREMLLEFFAQRR